VLKSNSVVLPVLPLLVLKASPEANHAVKGAIDEALRCKEEGVKQNLFNLCGHGHFDMQAYMAYQTVA